MKVFTEIAPLRTHLIRARKENFSVGFVPTMGALHHGHLALIKASKQENNLTVCSIYVNPTQFNNASDLQHYPRALEYDIAQLEATGCDLLFAPKDEEMYARPTQIRFDFGDLGNTFEGAFRPGHFNGVALVVSKLFNIVQPDKAYFGQKDFQQLAIVKRLVSELCFDLKIESVTTVRELSGLAMSSRNMRLSEEEKEKATIFYKSLLRARDLLASGRSWSTIRAALNHDVDSTPGVKLEYIALVDAQNLNPLESVSEIRNGAVILIAGFVGNVRLIDNLLLSE